MNLKKTFYHLFHPQRSNNHRPRVLHPISFIFFVLISIIFVGVMETLPKMTKWGDVLGFASSITPAQVVELTNKERTKRGLSKVTLNQKLSQAAQAKGQDMFEDQYWAHVAPDGKEPWAFFREADYSYRVAGENLARDFSNTTDMVKAWMGSPTHKANIINPKYQEIGIAVIDGKLKGYETTLVVQMFGTPRVAIAQIPVESNLQLTDLVSSNDEAVGSQVLSSVLVPTGSLVAFPLFSPLQLTKAFFLGLIMMIILTLVYDGVVIGNRYATRLVGKNLAHIIFFIAVSFILVLFKGGIVG